eukprot:TRINITY_DN7307_c0_g1_i11.p1 TRINITY_DN7307_c0_g1~~TRINITY_DN7307_c0_g1_i11.p1  ORF type:complete len:190 (-),score=-1.54 TRINITY_DN7307_c0_g1_i11:423-992(-)
MCGVILRALLGHASRKFQVKFVYYYNYYNDFIYLMLFQLVPIDFIFVLLCVINDMIEQISNNLMVKKLRFQDHMTHWGFLALFLLLFQKVGLFLNKLMLAVKNKQVKIFHFERYLGTQRNKQKNNVLLGSYQYFGAQKKIYKSLLKVKLSMLQKQLNNVVIGYYEQAISFISSILHANTTFVLFVQFSC